MTNDTITQTVHTGRPRVDPDCKWCGGSGMWNGYPCIKCNQPTRGQDLHGS